MKILFDNVDFHSRSGPNTFAIRLAKAMFVKGHTIADNNDYDIAISFIEPSYRVLTSQKPYIQRLDGIWFAPNEFETKNITIKASYNTASGIIFQSQFDKQFITKHWGIPKQYSVINNGIDLQEIDEIKRKNTNVLLQLKQQYEKIFVCSANWHPQKRLKSNYDLFLHCRDVLKINACLIVLGSNPTQCQYKHLIPHVFYTGNIPHEDCIKIYANSNCMFHMAFLDHSPNVIVECLAAGTPVICPSEGGTKELLNGFGLIIAEQEQFNNEPIYYDNPPDIDVTQVKCLPQFNKEQSEFTRSKLDINVIATAYEQMCERLI